MEVRIKFYSDTNFRIAQDTLFSMNIPVEEKDSDLLVDFWQFSSHREAITELVDNLGGEIISDFPY